MREDAPEANVNEMTRELNSLIAEKSEDLDLSGQDILSALMAATANVLSQCSDKKQRTGLTASFVEMLPTWVDDYVQGWAEAAAKDAAQ